MWPRWNITTTKSCHQFTLKQISKTIHFPAFDLAQHKKKKRKKRIRKKGEKKRILFFSLTEYPATPCKNIFLDHESLEWWPMKNRTVQRQFFMQSFSHISTSSSSVSRMQLMLPMAKVTTDLALQSLRIASTLSFFVSFNFYNDTVTLTSALETLIPVVYQTDKQTNKNKTWPLACCNTKYCMFHWGSVTLTSALETLIPVVYQTDKQTNKNKTWPLACCNTKYCMFHWGSVTLTSALETLIPVVYQTDKQTNKNKTWPLACCNTK